MHTRSRLLTSVILLSAACVRAQTFAIEQLTKVHDRLKDSATHSWELGTRAQALIEFDAPDYSVFGDSPVPPPRGNIPPALDEVLGIARDTANASRIGLGPSPLTGDQWEAAGDPPSLGVAVLLAGHLGAPGPDYTQAAADQLAFLLEKVPRAENGAISHRTEEMQLWSDFVYMVPPFMAYYGVLRGDQGIVQMAYDQCRLHRDYLMDRNASGLWKHIEFGPLADARHWTTGNGWAAAGMLRVLGTIMHSSFADSMRSQQADLASWVSEIHAALYPHLQPNGLFKNNADEAGSFDDASGTAIVAASVYRLALLTGTDTFLERAEESRRALVARIDDDGWVFPVVNPLNVGEEGSHSPEGQAFILQMHSAWRDLDAFAKRKEVRVSSALALRREWMTLGGAALAVAVLVGM